MSLRKQFKISNHKTKGIFISKSSISSDSQRSINPLFVVIGAVLISVLIVGVVYFVFNNSESAKRSRAESKARLEQRKERLKNSSDIESTDNQITDDSIEQETQAIDNTMQDVDQFNNSIKTDDLDDSSLGIN